MSQDASSVKYYKKNIERLQKHLVKGIKIFLKKKTKSENMVANDIKLPKYKKQRLVEYKKNIIKNGKIKPPTHVKSD